MSNLSAKSGVSINIIFMNQIYGNSVYYSRIIIMKKFDYSISPTTRFGENRGSVITNLQLENCPSGHPQKPLVARKRRARCPCLWVRPGKGQAVQELAFSSSAKELRIIEGLLIVYKTMREPILHPLQAGSNDLLIGFLDSLGIPRAILSMGISEILTPFAIAS